MGEALLDAMVNHHDQPRRGNRDAIMAPHNVYPCTEPGSWISIAVSTQEEWEALCAAVGKKDWLADSRFADRYLRWKNQDALDGMLAKWSKGMNAQEAMELLQEAGVPADCQLRRPGLAGRPTPPRQGGLSRAEDQEGNHYIMMGLRGSSPVQSPRLSPAHPIWANTTNTYSRMCLVSGTLRSGANQARCHKIGGRT